MQHASNKCGSLKCFNLLLTEKENYIPLDKKKFIFNVNLVTFQIFHTKCKVNNKYCHTTNIVCL